MYMWQSPKGKRFATICEQDGLHAEMENMKWYSPSHVPTAKHVSYPQLTATVYTF